MKMCKISSQNDFKKRRYKVKETEKDFWKRLKINIHQKREISTECVYQI